MRIADKNNNENASFGSYVTHFQPNMKTRISDAFRQKLAGLIHEFANHPRLHLSLYDVYSSDMVQVGYKKRTIGASVSVQEGYKVPDFKHSDFMVSALADSDGEDFVKSIRDLSSDLEFRYVPVSPKRFSAEPPPIPASARKSSSAKNPFASVPHLEPMSERMFSSENPFVSMPTQIAISATRSSSPKKPRIQRIPLLSALFARLAS